MAASATPIEGATAGRWTAPAEAGVRCSRTGPTSEPVRQRDIPALGSRYLAPHLIGRAPRTTGGAVDAELVEDFAQVVLDGAGADEELGADLHVGPTVLGQGGNLVLPRCELVGVVGGPSPAGAGGEQFVGGPAGERGRAHLREQLVGCAELGAGIEPPASPAEPFPVEEVGAGQFGQGSAATEPLDGGAVLLVCVVTVADDRPCSCLDAQGSLGAGCACLRARRSYAATAVSGSPVRAAASTSSASTRRADVVVLAGAGRRRRRLGSG